VLEHEHNGSERARTLARVSKLVDSHIPQGLLCHGARGWGEGGD
jgi:hypothetical protein